MSVVNHLQIIEIYFEGWIQRLKSIFFNQHTHTHKPTKSKTKPKNPIKTGRYIVETSFSNYRCVWLLEVRH